MIQKYLVGRIFVLTRYALLCGSAPNDYRQKKLNDLYDSLLETDGWNVTCMANGIDEFMLEYAFKNILSENAGGAVSGLLLYFCTETPVSESDSSFWLGSWEIQKNTITHYSDWAKQSKLDFQVIYDSDREFVSEKDLGYEKLSDEECREFIAKVKAGYIRIG